MRLNLIPLYGWYVLVVAGMILFAFPPLIAGDLLFELERAFDWPFFDPERGGDPLLWQHLFWIFGHPEVYIIFLPAIALVAMIVPTFAQRPILGYSWIVLAAVGTGFLSFGLWVHHMYATGLPAISLGFFSAASEAVAIPTGVQIFTFIATLLVGRVILSIPMLFVSGALAIFVIGGLTGVMVALAPFDWQAHDTYFIVAHLHYVLIGGMLFPVVAGIYYYFPLVKGRKLNPRLGKSAFWLMFVGFNVAFLPMHVTGLRGMPRRVFTYPEGIGWDWLNFVSSVGAFVFAGGILFVVIDVLGGVFKRRDSERNPWNAGTLEWLMEVPTHPWGTRSIPYVRSRYPLWEQPELMREVDEGRHFLPDADTGHREGLITTVADAVPLQVIRVPGPSFLPLLSAIATGGVFISTTYHAWTIAAISGVAALCLIVAWLWTGTARTPERRMRDIGMGLRVPVYLSGPRSVGWWGMLITMLGDSTAYASLIFGYFFFWTVHPEWPPADAVPLVADGSGLVWPLLAAACLVLAWWLVARVPAWLERGRELAMAAYGGAAIAAIGYGAALAYWLLGVARLDPSEHVYPATVLVLHLYAGVHVAVGLVMCLYGLARVAVGHATAEHDIDPINIRLFWHFALMMGATSLAVTALFPLVR